MLVTTTAHLVPMPTMRRLMTLMTLHAHDGFDDDLAADDMDGDFRPHP